MEDKSGGIIGITKAIGKTSSKVLKTTKLTINLANEESKLNNIYIAIGKKVHELYADGVNLGAFFDEKYLEITDAAAKIRDIKNRIDIVKGVRTCSKCGRTSPRSSRFCPKCGEDMGIIAEVEAEAEGEVLDVIEEVVAKEDLQISREDSPRPNEAVLIPQKICRACGSNNDETDKFCLTCGRVI